MAEPDTTRGDVPSELAEVIYKIVHDVRGSVRAIGELPTWIDEDLADEGVRLPDGPRHSFELLRWHAGKLNLMLDQLMQFVRAGDTGPDGVEEGKQSDPRKCLRRAVRMLALPDRVRIRARFDSNGAGLAPIDENVLTSILMIAVGNAASHNSEAIRIALCGGDNGQEWVLRIRDSGEGFPPGKLFQIFEPMRSYSRHDSGGCGMGLAILQRLIETRGGRVTAHHPAPPRAGAELRISLPCEAQNHVTPRPACDAKTRRT